MLSLKCFLIASNRINVNRCLMPNKKICLCHCQPIPIRKTLKQVETSISISSLHFMPLCNRREPTVTSSTHFELPVQGYPNPDLPFSQRNTCVFLGGRKCLLSKSISVATLISLGSHPQGWKANVRWHHHGPTGTA